MCPWDNVQFEVFISTAKQSYFKLYIVPVEMFVLKMKTTCNLLLVILWKVLVQE